MLVRCNWRKKKLSNVRFVRFNLLHSYNSCKSLNSIFINHKNSRSAASAVGTCLRRPVGMLQGDDATSIAQIVKFYCLRHWWRRSSWQFGTSISLTNLSLRSRSDRRACLDGEKFWVNFYSIFRCYLIKFI
jgi:hypothetical protein